MAASRCPPHWPSASWAGTWTWGPACSQSPSCQSHRRSPHCCRSPSRSLRCSTPRRCCSTRHSDTRKWRQWQGLLKWRENVEKNVWIMWAGTECSYRKLNVFKEIFCIQNSKLCFRHKLMVDMTKTKRRRMLLILRIDSLRSCERQMLWRPSYLWNPVLNGRMRSDRCNLVWARIARTFFSKFSNGCLVRNEISDCCDAAVLVSGQLGCEPIRGQHSVTWTNQGPVLSPHWPTRGLLLQITRDCSR